jgi:phosphopentomutase
MPRAFLFVLDSVGIGGAPDAAAFGDAGADTLGHIAEPAPRERAEEGRSGPLALPHLDRAGPRRRRSRWPRAAARRALGRAAGGGMAPASERSRGKDTPSGHWELAGVPVPFDWGYFPRRSRPSRPS